MSRTASAKPSLAEEEATVALRFEERGDEFLRLEARAVCFADGRLRVEDRVTGPLSTDDDESADAVDPFLGPSFVLRFL
jgi:hypothetical protein